jgi:hypothetical protein
VTADAHDWAVVDRPRFSAGDEARAAGDQARLADGLHALRALRFPFLPDPPTPAHAEEWIRRDRATAAAGSSGTCVCSAASARRSCCDMVLSGMTRCSSAPPSRSVPVSRPLVWPLAAVTVTVSNAAAAADKKRV